MSTTKSNWIFSLLWINVAVGLVVFIRVIGSQARSAREILSTLAFSLLFANLTGVLAIVVIGVIAARAKTRQLPLMPTFLVCILVFIPAGCLLAQALLMAFGVIAARQFWPTYLNTLRFSMPLGAVFGLGALVHALLRERVRVAEEKLHEKEVAEQRAQKLAAEARLSSLESRIHPHFLFNTLNAISSAIAVNPARAEQIVGKLAVLLRASLDNSNQTLIPLEEELAMVESYLDIEKSRFGDKLRASTQVAPDLRSAMVPPMSVQALVENAVKHGIAPQRGGGDILIAASAQNGNLTIEVRDSGPGFNLAAIPAGHGLDNLVERLHALFSDKARLDVFMRDGQSVVEMVFPHV
jgi:sensor histidine kinase YesM